MKKAWIVFLLLITNAAAFSLFGSHPNVDRQYLDAVRDVRDIVITTQKTRGLTNNFMNGNVVAQLLVYGERKNMKENFKKLEALFASMENLPAGYRKKAEALMERARKLNKKAFRRKSAEVFDAYTGIIEEWLALNREMIDGRFGGKDAGVYEMLLFQNETLLPLTENIGKMRGLGSGIVARGRCNEKETPKMLGFADEIERYRKAMTAFLQRRPLVAGEELEAVNGKIGAYVKLTRTKVIGKKGIRLDPNAYFDQGTACIGAVSKIYDEVSAEIDRKIGK